MAKSTRHNLRGAQVSKVESFFVTLGVRADSIEQLVFETAIYSGKRFYVVVNKKMEF